MDNHFYPIIITFLSITALIGSGLALYLFFRKHTPGIRSLGAEMIMGSIWALTYVAEFLSTNPEQKVLWSKLSYFGIAFAPLCYYQFIYNYTSHYGLFFTKKFFALSLVPFVTIIMVLTNDYHHFHWTSTEYIADKQLVIYHHGPWFWVFFLYTYTLLLTGFIKLLIQFKSSPNFYRPQNYTIVFAALLPIIGNLMYITNLNPIPGIDWTPFGYLLSGLLIILGIDFYGFFDLLPFARGKLMESLDDGVMVIDTNQRIADYNYALSKFFPLNKKEKTRIHIDEAFANYPELKLLITKKNKPSIIVKWHSNENNPMFVEATSNIIFDDFGKFSGTIITFHDVSIRKITQQKLEETNARLLDEIKQKEQLIQDLHAFSHTVAHDLKNALGAISSTSELLEENISEKDYDSAASIAKIIRKAASKSINITRELLLLASIQKEQIAFRPVDCKTHLNEAIERLQFMIEESGTIISISQSDWPLVEGYGQWIEEIWVNYLSNAIKYGGTPPRIVIGFHKLPENRVQFYIKDNGRGIEPEKQHLLFNEFVRLEEHRVEGLGLGLSIVKRIINKLNGEVDVESNGLEQGSIFFFTLNQYSGKNK